MKRINNKAAAVEAVLTRHGTIVGPFMTDLTGYPELTPTRAAGVATTCSRKRSPTSSAAGPSTWSGVSATGSGTRVYKGFFEFDILIDTDDGEVYMGEVNPRISGVSSMTNTTVGAYADLPLVCFHLLEFMDIDYEIDVDEINERWRNWLLSTCGRS